ncbi:MAG: ATP phosphoribosyltransferase [Candidatus ainarchaeum sp.]|nr:ATP phosphoribosyltransferase [Candidatus ainarchaeum sp.]
MPSKGRMREPSFRLLEEAGMKPLDGDGRKLLVPTSLPGVRVLFVRAMDIPIYVGRRAADLGICGEDAVREWGIPTSSAWGINRELVELLQLDFGACKVALAAPQRVKWPQKEVLAIATALPRIAEQYCRRNSMGAKIIALQGALEAAPGLGLADAIVDQVVTGNTLLENGLRILDVILESRMCLYGNPASLEVRKAEMDSVALLARAVIEARKRVMLRVNAATDMIRDTLAKLLPAMKSADVSPLAGGGYALAAAVPKEGLEDLLVKTRAVGGTGIVVEQPKLIIP